MAALLGFYIATKSFDCRSKSTQRSDGRGFVLNRHLACGRLVDINARTERAVVRHLEKGVALSLPCYPPGGIVAIQEAL